MNPLEPSTPHQPPQDPVVTPETNAWQQPTPQQTPVQPAQSVPQEYPAAPAPEPVETVAPTYQEPIIEQQVPSPLVTSQPENTLTPPAVSPITFASMTPTQPTPPPSARKKLMLLGATFLVLFSAGFASYLIITKGQENNSATDLGQSDPGATTITEDALSTLDSASTTGEAATSDTKKSASDSTSDSSSSTTNNDSSQKPSSSSQTTDSQKPSKPPTSTKVAAVSCAKDPVSQKAVSSSILQQTAASVNAAVAGKSSSLTSWLPAQYRYNDKESQAGTVDASYKGLQPVSCTAFPVVIRKKNSFSQQGATLIIRFTDNKSKKNYVSSINVALVGSQWKTDRITAARTN